MTPQPGKQTERPNGDQWTRFNQLVDRSRRTRESQHDDRQRN